MTDVSHPGWHPHGRAVFIAASILRKGKRVEATPQKGATDDDLVKFAEKLSAVCGQPVIAEKLATGRVRFSYL